MRAFFLYSYDVSKSMKFSRSPNTSFSLFEILNIKAQYFYCQIQGLLKFRIYEKEINIAWEWSCLHISSSRPFAHEAKRNEMDNSSHLKSDQSMFSYSQTLEFYRMCVIVVVGNVVQHEWPILMRRGGLYLRGRELLRGFGVFLCGFVFFPRDTPLTQQAVNCNEWSLIVAPLAAAATGVQWWGQNGYITWRWWWSARSTRSSNSRSPVSVSWVVILAHYDIVITFCYLVTIPKHINDMEDIVVTPNLMCYL
jgi:hypothetical protein